MIKGKVMYTVFNQNKVNTLEQTMFLGEPVNVARYDMQKYPIFEKLTEKQLSFFWRPEEVEITKDKRDFETLTDNEKHIFISNLKYQILLDSIQGRSPNTVLLPLVSLPELETWIETWAFSETIHSRSYTHIIRNLFPNPSVIFDDIIDNPAIIKRAEQVSKHYDDLLEWVLLYQQGKVTNYTELKRKLYLCLVSIYALEGIRFYISFACSFAFGERKLMEGNAKIIKMIARDESLHMASTAHIINNLAKDDSEFGAVINELDSIATHLFFEVAEQEKEWVNYLFKNGSMLGLNDKILNQYIEYITNNRMQGIGLTPIYSNIPNPINWINNWLNSDNVQVAPQETEITSYLVGQIDADVGDLSNFEL